MEATADQLLTKLEQALVKLDAAQGSSVKLQKAEYDFLTAVEKFRDFITQVVQDTSDRDRRSFQSIFGGDCMRIAKGRAVIEASKTKLSERSLKDQRLQTSLNSIDTAEHVLQDLGLKEKLAEAQGISIPWRGAGAKEAAAAAAPTPPPAPAPEPKPAPPAPAPAPEPVEKSVMNPTLTAPKGATREVIVTSEAEKVEQKEDDGKHKVQVDMSVALDGHSFEFGDDKTFYFNVPALIATVKTDVTPPFPASVKPKAFDPEQSIRIAPPEMTKIVFDPTKGSPKGGRWTHTLKLHVDLLDIPGAVEVEVGSRSSSPWGGEQLIEGKDITQMHYQVQIDGDFSMATGPESTGLGIDLTFTFCCAISGAKTEKYSSDGSILPAPEPGTL